MRRNAMIRGMAWALALLLLLPGCGGHEETPPEPTPTPTQHLLIPGAEHSVPPVAEPTPDPTPTEPLDTVPPVISGMQNLTVEVGGTVSYRTGVTAVDDVDGAVSLSIDTSYVDLTTPGEYPVVYSAVDAAGNLTEEVVLLTVVEPEPTPAPDPAEDQVYAMIDEILPTIINDSMTARQKAEAIYNYIVYHMWYTITQSNGWADAALYALKNQKGDCTHYWALSKAMLTRAGIPTVDVQRINGNSEHFWVLADVGDEAGYYHFDPCPHPKGYPLNCFLLGEDEVYAYTLNLNLYSAYYQNYYTWDIENCPVKVAGADKVGEVPMPTPIPPSTPAPVATPAPEEPVQTEAPTEQEAPVETETPTEPEVPGETEVPTEPEVPVQTETPTETEEPGETEVPTEPEVPVQTETPTEPEVPVQTETPTEPEAPVQTETPTEPEVPVQTETPSEPEPPTEPEPPADPPADPGVTEPEPPATEG